jgi:hypothetical protein
LWFERGVGREVKEVGCDKEVLRGERLKEIGEVLCSVQVLSVVCEWGHNE